MKVSIFEKACSSVDLVMDHLLQNIEQTFIKVAHELDSFMKVRNIAVMWKGEIRNLVIRVRIQNL